MIKVNSSTIDAYSYDAAAMALTIQFKSGGAYIYRGVPADIADTFAASDSPGSYFHQVIKPAYQGEKR